MDAENYSNFIVSVETCFETEYVVNFGDCSVRCSGKGIFFFGLGEMLCRYMLGTFDS